MNEWCFIFSIFVCVTFKFACPPTAVLFFRSPLSSFVNRMTSTMTMTRMGSAPIQGRRAGGDDAHDQRCDAPGLTMNGTLTDAEAAAAQKKPAPHGVRRSGGRQDHVRDGLGRWRWRRRRRRRGKPATPSWPAVVPEVVG